jgi:hypothetical protein
MKFGLATRICLVVALLAPFAGGAEKQYQTGRMLSLEEKTNTRILYYQVDTPITKDEIYYEVTVQLKDGVYLGRYTPRHSSDTLPVEWGKDEEVPARVQGRHLWLQKPTGSELEFVIVKVTPVKTEQKGSTPPSMH